MRSVRSSRKAVLVGVPFVVVLALAFAAGSFASRQRATVQGDPIPGIDISIEQSPSGIMISPPTGTGTGTGLVGSIMVVQTGSSSLFPPASNNYNSAKSNTAGIVFTEGGSPVTRVSGNLGVPVSPFYAQATDPSAWNGDNGPKQLAIACYVDPAVPAGRMQCWMTDWQTPAAITKAITIAGFASRLKGDTGKGFVWHKLTAPAQADGAEVEAVGGATIWDGVWLLHKSSGPIPLNSVSTTTRNITNPTGVKTKPTTVALISEVDHGPRATFSH